MYHAPFSLSLSLSLSLSFEQLWRQCIYQHHQSLCLCVSPKEREYAINEEKEIDHARAAVLGLALLVHGFGFGGVKKTARSLVIIAEHFRV
jgi:hypothetical protein